MVAESLVYSAGNSEILANVKYIQALVRKKQKQWSEAAKLARESVIIGASLQRQSVIIDASSQRELCTLEPEAMAWNWFFCVNMKEAFWLLQDLYATSDLKQAEISLWWAERANMRCFVHQMNRQPLETPLLNPVDLDECDTLLHSVVLITARSFSAKTAIIHYSYNPDRSKILMYVVRHCPSSEIDVRENIQITVFVKVCHLPTWFENAGLPHTTRLEAVIKKAQTDIQNEADNKGKGPSKDRLTLQSLRQYGAEQKGKGLIKDLCTLHSLLVEFIEPALGDCDTLIIAPGHGCLSSVPFAALTDQRTGKFLVESKAIALIPSIMILHHCLHRQLKFEMNNQLPVNPENVSYPSFLQSCNPDAIDSRSNWVPSKVAFIAGSPEPMGLGLPHLGFARFEVSLVASYFGVQPCLGRNMSKKAVLDGLASSSLVLLATHGMVDDWYPYGCLVMKGPEEGGAESCGKTAGMEVGAQMAELRQLLSKAGCGAGGGEEEQASSSNTQMKYGDGPETGHRIFQHTDERSQRRKEEEQHQVLTAAEIAGVEGGISAGLVVLSACESGLGAETESEGVLGLGRALLQGGAASALLTLWKVHDGRNMAFISGLLHCAAIDRSYSGKTVCECLQLMMQAWIDLGLPIKWWAPFQLMGSPLIRLSAMHGIKEKGALWLDDCAFAFFGTRHGTRCSFPCRVCDRKFEVEIDAHSLPTLFESIPVHPYIGRVVQTYALPFFDQLPPEHAHVLVHFLHTNLCFVAKRDGNVSQVVQTEVNIKP